MFRCLFTPKTERVFISGWIKNNTAAVRKFNMASKLSISATAASNITSDEFGFFKICRVDSLIIHLLYTWICLRLRYITNVKRPTWNCRLRFSVKAKTMMLNVSNVKYTASLLGVDFLGAALKCRKERKKVVQWRQRRQKNVQNVWLTCKVVVLLNTLLLFWSSRCRRRRCFGSWGPFLESPDN